MVVSAVPSQLSPGAACKGLPGRARQAPCATRPCVPSPPGAQESCSQRCGNQSGPCSCHPTCFGLASCCVDVRDFCLEISPYSGSMMGGKDFVVQHLNWSNPADSVICRWEAPEGARWGPDPQRAGWGPRTEGWGYWPDGFPGRRLGALERVGPRQPSLSTPSAPRSFKESIQTRGYVDASGRVHCVSPLLYESGRIPFTLSMDNGRSFPRSGTWLSGEPDGDGRMAGEEGTGPHPPGPSALPGTLLGNNLVEPVTLEACPGCGLPRLLSPPTGIHAGVPAQREED